MTDSLHQRRGGSLLVWECSSLIITVTHIQQVDTDHGFIVGTDVCDLARVCSCMFFITFNDIRESTLFISLQKGKKKLEHKKQTQSLRIN